MNATEQTQLIADLSSTAAEWIRVGATTTIRNCGVDLVPWREVAAAVKRLADDALAEALAGAFAAYMAGQPELGELVFAQRMRLCGARAALEVILGGAADAASVGAP